MWNLIREKFSANVVKVSFSDKVTSSRLTKIKNSAYSTFFPSNWFQTNRTQGPTELILERFFFSSESDLSKCFYVGSSFVVREKNLTH